MCTLPSKGRCALACWPHVTLIFKKLVLAVSSVFELWSPNSVCTLPICVHWHIYRPFNLEAVTLKLLAPAVLELFGWLGKVSHPVSMLAAICDVHVKDMGWAVCGSSSKPRTGRDWNLVCILPMKGRCVLAYLLAPLTSSFEFLWHLLCIVFQVQVPNSPCNLPMLQGVHWHVSGTMPSLTLIEVRTLTSCVTPCGISKWPLVHWWISSLVT